MPLNKQSPQPPAHTTKPVQGLSANSPILLSDSSDEDGYSTAPGSPINASTELERAQNEALFYKKRCAVLEQQLQALSRSGAAANHPTRSERKQEATARREQHEARGPASTSAQPSKQYISQAEQIRDAMQYRIPALMAYRQKKPRQKNKPRSGQQKAKRNAKNAAKRKAKGKGKTKGETLSLTAPPPPPLPPPSIPRAVHEAGSSQPSAPHVPHCPAEAGGWNCADPFCQFQHYYK